MSKLSWFSVLLISFLSNCSPDEDLLYKLSVIVDPSAGGKVQLNLSNSDSLFLPGTLINLTASANPNYVFKSWSGDASGDSETISVSMTSDKTIRAVFEKVKYDLEVTVEGNGTVNQKVVKSGRAETLFPWGTILELTALPSPGWRFLEWAGDFSGTKNPLEIEFNSQQRVTARFECIPFCSTCGRVDAMDVQSDQKLVFGNLLQSTVRRLNQDGTFDQNFLSNPVLTSGVSVIKTDPSDRILVGGVGMVRLKAAGELDPSFNLDPLLSGSSIEDIEVQPDGRIILAGYFGTNFPEKPVQRLNVDGSLDMSFVFGYPRGNGAREIELQPDGRIIVLTVPSEVLRVNSDGSVDPTFVPYIKPGSTDLGATNALLGLEVRPDGKIVVGEDWKLVLLNSDGQVDGSFKNPFPAPITYFPFPVFKYISEIVSLSDNSLLVGRRGNSSGWLDKVKPNGLLDDSFKGGTFDGPVNRIIVQNGALLVGGQFSYYNQYLSSGLIRTASDGGYCQ